MATASSNPLAGANNHGGLRPPFSLGVTMKKQITFIWAVSLALFLYSVTAHAASPSSFSLTAAEISAPSIVRSGVNLLIPSTATANLPSTGTASATSVARKMIARVGGFKGIATVGIVAIAGYAAYVESHSADFPITYKLLHPESTSPQYVVGSVISTAYGNMRCTTTQTWNYASPILIYKIDSPSVHLSVNGGYITTYTLASDQRGATPTSFMASAGTNSYFAPSTLPVTPVEPPIQTPSLSELLPTELPRVLPEVDKYIQANPDAVATPPELPAQVKDAERKMALDTQKEELASRVANKTDIRNAAQSRYDANPTDENRIALQEAEAALHEANSDLEEIKKQLADDDSAAPPPTPEYEEINFQPLQNLGDDLGDKFPFTLLATLKNFALGLVATPQAPSFNIQFPAPFNYTWHVSLERFDPIARMVRVLIGMAFLAYVTMALLRRFH